VDQEAAWILLERKLGSDACAKIREAGGIGYVQEAGTTLYVPPGRGHWAWSVGGSSYITAREPKTGARVVRDVAVSMVVWHTPCSGRVDMTKMIARGDVREAQLDFIRGQGCKNIAEKLQKVIDADAKGQVGREAEEPVTDASKACVWVGQSGVDETSEFHRIVCNIALSHPCAAWAERGTLDAPFVESHQAMTDDLCAQMHGEASNEEQIIFTGKFAVIVNARRSKKINDGAACSMFEAHPLAMEQTPAVLSVYKDTDFQIGTSIEVSGLVHGAYLFRKGRIMTVKSTSLGQMFE